MEFWILGPLGVWEEGRQIRLAGSRRRALLALFLLNANQVISSDRLIEELWEAEPPDSGAKALGCYAAITRR